MRPILLGILVIFWAMLFNACKPNAPCPPVKGSWIGLEGRKLVLHEDGKAQLITFFGNTASDTFFARYRYDCTVSPALLDLVIDSTMLRGMHSNLYGLLVWSGDTSFSYHAETGKTDATRPKDFRLEDAQVFRRDSI